MGEFGQQPVGISIELVRRAMERDADAFEELIRGEEAFLLGLALGRCRNRDQARDIVQDALLSAWQKLPTLREPRAFRGWLGKIVLNNCVEAARKRDRYVPLPDDWSETVAAPASKASSDVQKEESLHEGIQELDEDKQMILALRYAEKLGYGEIAERLGISHDAVRGRLFSAREKLRSRMRRKTP